MKVYAGFLAVVAMVGTAAYQSIQQAPAQSVAETTTAPIVAGLIPVSDVATSQQVAINQKTMPIRRWKQGKPQPYYVFSGKKFQLAQQPNWATSPRLGDLSLPGTKPAARQAANRPQLQQVAQQVATIDLRPQPQLAQAMPDQPQQAQSQPVQSQQAQVKTEQPPVAQAIPEQPETVAASQFDSGLDDLFQKLLPAELDQVGTATLLDMQLARLRDGSAIAANPTRRTAMAHDRRLPAFPEGMVSPSDISPDGISAVPAEVDLAANNQQPRRGMAAQTNERMVL